MNKQLIITYFEEFKHWLNGGKVLSKYTLLPEWSDYQTEDIWRIPDKDISKVLIVIDDKYVEFRKAMAEGKTIQCNAKEGENDITYTAYGHTWWEDTTEFKYATTFYRIKPEEPKFKVGDWVRAPSGSIYQINETNTIHGTEHFTPWQPEPSEWCWFHNGTVESLYFYKFHSIISEGYIADIPKDIEHIMTSQIFKYCEPFIGKLPTIIKDT